MDIYVEYDGKIGKLIETGQQPWKCHTDCCFQRKEGRCLNHTNQSMLVSCGQLAEALRSTHTFYFEEVKA